MPETVVILEHDPAHRKEEDNDQQEQQQPSTTAASAEDDKSKTAELKVRDSEIGHPGQETVDQEVEQYMEV